MTPSWLHILSIVSVAVGIVCAIVIALDETRDRQHMMIMNFVWPLTALFASVLALVAYYKIGKLKAHSHMHGEHPRDVEEIPFALKVLKGASHCGSGCTLGDLCAEWLAFGVPAVAAWLGWHTFFNDKIFAVWILDFIIAFAFGIAFQYFTIVPMRDLSFGRGIIEAVKADTLSLTSWQIGMYGFMAIAHFYIFGVVLDTPLHTDSFEFWFMMQIAMLAGFATAYPVNWWLIRIGVKEAM